MGQRHRLSALEETFDTHQVYLAAEITEGFGDALEAFSVLSQADRFRIYQMIDNSDSSPNHGANAVICNILLNDAMNYPVQ